MIKYILVDYIDYNINTIITEVCRYPCCYGLWWSTYELAAYTRGWVCQSSHVPLQGLIGTQQFALIQLYDRLIVWKLTLHTLIARFHTRPGPRFNIKMISYQYRKSHCGDKTVVRSSYLHNGISYTGKRHVIIESGPSILNTYHWLFTSTNHTEPCRWLCHGAHNSTRDKIENQLRHFLSSNGWEHN